MFAVGNLIVRRFSGRVAVILTEPKPGAQCLIYYLFSAKKSFEDLEYFVVDSVHYDILKHYVDQI